MVLGPLRPYAELEDPGSLYISGIAVKEAWRGQGIGTRLMAMALHRRLGFREAARRRIVPHPSLEYSEGDAVLMVRTLD